MARIAGVDLPRDKRIEAALQYIFGIGLTSANVSAKNSIATFQVTMEVVDIEALARVLARIEQLPNVSQKYVEEYAL